MKKLLPLLLFVCSMTTYGAESNGIVYVKPGGTGDGSSWSNAMGDIQTAINAAKATNDARKDVWVAGGEFTLTSCISMADSVNVYGSFAGTETSKDQRAQAIGAKAWEFSNPTTLNGNKAVRLVQVAANFDVETIFDGFILTDGNGKGSATDGSGGAALLRPNAVLQNCIVQKSTSNSGGGGIMMNTGGTVRFCLIKDNKHTTGANGGGGIFCNTSSAGHTAYIENCEITGNSSNVRGAGIGVQGNTPTHMKNLVIYNNVAEGKQGGAIFQNSPHNTLTNSLIYNNSGSNAIQLQGSVFNTTIVNNVGGVYLANKTIAVEFSNNIIWGCFTEASGTTATGLAGVDNPNFVTHNNATYTPIANATWQQNGNILLSSNASNGDVENPAAGTIGSGAKFMKVTTFRGVATTDEQLAELLASDWRLLSASPCVNSGKTLAGIATDIRGVARPQNTAYDMGAYEFHEATDLTTSVRPLQTFACSVYYKTGSIVVTGMKHPTKVAVYTTTGERVYDKLVTEASVEVPLQRGMYIVKTGNTTQRVLVK